MRIWYDACTGKHVRYGAAIAKRLEEKGHEIIFTTRKHPDTVSLAKYLNLKFNIVGEYDPSSKPMRLYKGLLRQIEFCKMFKDEPPNVAVSHGSVDLCRVAFGLGVPIISTYDTPHADAVSRLTIPLSDVVVASRAIPENYLRAYGAKRVVTFDGVDEVAWMRNFKPKVKYDFGRPLIIVRQLETKAAYAEDLTADVTERIAAELTSLGKVIFLARYNKKPRNGLIVPKDFIDSASLASQADLVVSAGGTIAREAALAGTPSIVIKIFEGMHVNEYLANKGFPIFTVNPEDVIDYSKKYLGKRFDTAPLINTLEDPVDIIEDIIEEIK
jgi:predicted glycosyltransferase